MCSRIPPPKVTSPPFHPGGGEGTVTRRLGEFALLVLHSLLQNSLWSHRGEHNYKAIQNKYLIISSRDTITFLKKLITETSFNHGKTTECLGVKTVVYSFHKQVAFFKNCCRPILIQN